MEGFEKVNRLSRNFRSEEPIGAIEPIVEKLPDEIRNRKPESEITKGEKDLEKLIE